MELVDKLKCNFPLDTTRPIRTGEVPGREYIFIPRDKMEADIQAGKFIEHGEYKGHLYGTSAESVRSIVNAGCVCILSPHYQAIKALRTPQLKPFIIHVKPPTFEQLKETREAAHARSTFDETNSRGFSVSFFLCCFLGTGEEIRKISLCFRMKNFRI